MAVVASAPGKVLMTGGYLILERPNAGIVLSTNARFYAIVKPLHEDIEPDSWAWAWTDVKLTSPQLSRETMYKIESRNPFVEQAVQYTIAAARATLDKNNNDFLQTKLLQGLDITILGCNDFYSYRNYIFLTVEGYGQEHGILEFYGQVIEARGLPLTPDVLAALPPFTPITFNAEESNGENCKPEVAKTGLGSSAAMTTSVVAALLHYFGVVNLSSLNKDQHQEKDCVDLDLVHVIAQSAHCIAQGKVGSGFDVSSAVYGSQRYVRFSPEVLSSAQKSKLSMIHAVFVRYQWANGICAPMQINLKDIVLSFKIFSSIAEEELDGFIRYLDYQPQTSSIFLGSNGNSNIVMDDRIIRLKKIFSVHNTLCISGEKVAVKGLPIQEVIHDILKGNWDHERTKFSLPPLMTLLLGEPGAGGSSTPSMVGAVKKWQKSDPEKSLETWRKLSAANSALETQFKILSKLAEENWDAYKCVINSCSIHRSEKWTERATGPDQEAVVNALLAARDAMLRIRSNMRQMGEAAGIPIEPDSQTRLLDATMDMEGVLLAGVPGAGGFDAIFAVTLGDSSSNITKAWTSLNVLAMLVREDPHGVSLETGDPRAQQITSAISSVHIE
uniref:phosphomevalonate kinase n=1 Tax=Vitis vinifera TaxID=29760 RepID=A5BLG4_VITVI|nr:hypothetical protein VITISV_005973 [Vitis vinifera]